MSHHKTPLNLLVLVLTQPSFGFFVLLLVCVGIVVVVCLLAFFVVLVDIFGLTVFV